MEVFNLNIIPGAVAPIIHASQYDEDREFRANLFEGDQVFELTGAEDISVNVRKPDGNVVTAAVVNTGSNYVEFSTTLQMTACAGANLCQLRIENSPRKIGTLNFILAVERDPLEGGIQSESEINNLETQVAGMVAEAVADQYDSNAVIFDAEPTAGHGVGYAVTSEGVKTEVDALSAALAGKVDTTDFYATNLPIESGSATNTKDYIDSGLSGKADKTELVKFFDLTASSTTSDSGISPFSYYGQPTKTDSNIHNILSVTVIDTQFNNPAIAVLYGVSGNVYTFMVYSARSGNVKIRVTYN